MIDKIQQEIDVVKDVFREIRGKIGTDDQVKVINALSTIHGYCRDFVFFEGTDKVDDKSFLEWLRSPSDKPLTTHIPQLDPFIKFVPKSVNTWTGYQNEGKSTFLYFLLLIRCLVDGESIAVFAPESKTRNKLMKMLVMILLNRKSLENESDEVIFKAYNLINDHFFFVYPDRHHIDDVERDFKNIIKTKGVKHCVIDPVAKVTMGGNGDIADRSKQFMADRSAFATNNNIIYNIVMHQLDKNTQMWNSKEGEYVIVDKPTPSTGNVRGGGNIPDSSDNIFYVHRPFLASDPSDPRVCFGNLKVKETEFFDRGTVLMTYSDNRYYINGEDLFENAIRDSGGIYGISSDGKGDVPF